MARHLAPYDVEWNSMSKLEKSLFPECQVCRWNAVFGDSEITVTLDAWVDHENESVTVPCCHNCIMEWMAGDFSGYEWVQFIRENILPTAATFEQF